MRKIEELISDEDLEAEFIFTDFGDISYRDIVKYSLLKYACGYSTGHTALCCCENLGLVKMTSARKFVITKFGKEYLYIAFYNNVSL